MEWGQQMSNHQTNMMDSTYQNSNYSRERETRKTLIIDSGTINADKTFSLTLQEPFIIDKLSDIYLESFTTFKALNSGAATQNMGFILGIDQFNIQNNTTNKHLFKKIYIPNEALAADTYTHKAKKLNYICQINPTKLKNITGTITDCNIDGGSLLANLASGGRFIAEFVIVSRD
jgi:hypothetical protein